MITLDQVAKSFGEEKVLESLSFSVDAGERVSIVGPGGCGKTLALKILLGLETADSGTAELMGETLLDLPTQSRESLLKRVGMAFQQGGLFDFMTVRENLLFAMSNMTELSAEEMDESIKRLLNAVKLGRTENMFPHELSGGMKRRVGIVRALCTVPSVAIFDEPTSGLDPVTSTIIIQMIQELGSDNADACLLVATTNVEIAIRFAERIVVINEGKVVADGLWKDLLVDGSDWVQNFLGVRFIGLDLDYAKGLHLPQEFIARHW